MFCEIGQKHRDVICVGLVRILRGQCQDEAGKDSWGGEEVEDAHTVTRPSSVFTKSVSVAR